MRRVTRDEEAAVSKARHMAVQEVLVMIVPLIVAPDWAGHVRRLDNATTLAPLIDPTLYMKKGRDAERELEVAKVLDEAKEKLQAVGKRFPTKT